MSEAKASFTYRRSPDVVSTTIDRDETVLLDLRSLRYFSLNETGSRIWRHLTGDADLIQIAETLTKEYEIDAHEAHRYVTAHIAELEAEGLILPTGVDE